MDYSKTWRTRVIAGFAFFFVAVLYDKIVLPTNDYQFTYALAALVDALFVRLLPILGNTALTRDLQKINLACVINHFYGWVIYMCYLQPSSYNAIAYSLIIANWLRLIWISPEDNDAIDNTTNHMVLHRDHASQKCAHAKEN
jgi:hypothetical protein